jgi:hypothetical protein
MSSKAHNKLAGGKHHKKSSKKSKSKRHPHGLHIRRSDNGGYIAEHQYRPDPNDPDAPAPATEEHILPDIGMLQQHVGEHLGPPENPVPESPQQPPPGQDQLVTGGV